MAVLDQLVGGVLTEVIVITGRRLSAGLGTPRGRRRHDAALATWFDTYELVTGRVHLPDVVSEARASELSGLLRRDDAHAVIHELLAVRLTDAPETEAARLAELFRSSLTPAGDGLADRIFAYLDEQICELVGGLARMDPAVLHRIREEAQLSRINATLRAIERHQAAYARRGDPAAEADFVRRYRRHVREHHGRIEPPDFERRRRVPIADLYVTPTVTYRTSPPERIHRIDLWRLLANLDRAVLLGDPGGGKSTACHVIMHHHAADPARRVPFLVSLREFAAQVPQRSVVGHVEFKLETFYQCAPPEGLLERLLLAGSALVIFDGLDELTDTYRRSEISSLIERFCAEYPLASVLVTSRTVGYEQARLDDPGFRVHHLAGFDGDQVGDYVRRWFAQEEGVTDEQAVRWAEAFLRESDDLPDLRTNPLLLALMCILYRGEGSLPRNRPEVYGQCATLLFRKWDSRRRIEADLRARNLVEPALRHLAFWLLSEQGPDPIVEHRRLVAETASYFHGRGFEDLSQAEDAAVEFVNFCRGRAWVFSDVGTTADGQSLYAFTHRTFAEYFAAVHLAGVCDTPEALARTLAPRVAKEEWDTVAQLAVQTKCQATDRGAERFFETMLNERRRRAPAGRGNVLGFLCRCLPAALPPPRVVRRLTDLVLDHLLGDPDGQGLALGELLVASDECRAIVTDQLQERIAALIADQDPPVRSLGLRLAVHGCIGARNIVGSRRGSALDSENAGYWWSFAWENARRLGAELRAMASGDDQVAFTALVYGHIDLAEFLAPGRLELLFSRLPVGINEFYYNPQVEPCLLAELRPDSDPRSHATPPAHLRQFLDYVESRGDPPWVDGAALYFRENLLADLRAYVEQTGARPRAEPFDDREYAGGALMLLIVAETSPQHDEDLVGDDVLGRFSPLRPYILRRWKSSAEPLPELSAMPGPYARLCAAWADRSVDFVHGPAGR